MTTPTLFNLNQFFFQQNNVPFDDKHQCLVHWNPMYDNIDEIINSNQSLKKYFPTSLTFILSFEDSDNLTLKYDNNYKKLLNLN